MTVLLAPLEQRQSVGFVAVQGPLGIESLSLLLLLLLRSQGMEYSPHNFLDISWCDACYEPPCQKNSKASSLSISDFELIYHKQLN